MRVCILTRGDLFPTNHGAAVKIVRTAEHLAARDVTTCIVTDDRDRYLRYTASGVEHVPYPPRVRAAQEWPPLPRLGAWSSRLCDAVGYPREEHFLYRPIFDPAWWLRAAAVGAAENIDWFQAEFPGYGAPAFIASRSLTALRRLRGRPKPARSSIVQHNVEWDRLAEFGHDTRRIRVVEQLLLRLADEVIAVSDDDRRRMAAAGTPRDKITVIPHGVDAEAFARARGDGIRARYGLAPDTPLLFFHGTLHYWPNTEAVRFIAEQLLPRLLSERPEIRVLVAGQNPPAYYAHPAMVFAGPVEDLPAHVAAADLCLCPLFAGGGTRLKLLEYMAAGRAIVSTTKGAEGIACQPGEHLELADDPDAMADRVLALLDDPARRAR
ncbi:MAG: glycosyltransferase, partial [Deltaproteobacteria bacterium]